MTVDERELLARTTTPLSPESVGQALQSRFGLQFKPWTQALERLLRPQRTTHGASGDHSGAPANVRDSEQLLDLMDRLMLGHTRFYRHENVWEWLGATATPLPETNPLRVLVAGCSTGEEAYTAAAVLEARGGRRGVQVVGVDLNRRSVEFAEQGSYGVQDLQRIPEFLRRKLFVSSTGSRLQVAPALKQNVLFRQHNLLAPLDLGAFDLIFLRNVLVYLTPQASAQVLRNLLDVLNPQGLLVVAPQETWMVQDLPLVPAAVGLPVFRLVESTHSSPEASQDTPPASIAPKDQFRMPVELEPGALADGATQADGPERDVEPLSGPPVIRTEGVLMSRSPSWNHLRKELGETLANPPAALTLDLSLVTGADLGVRKSIGAFVRLLVACGASVRVEAPKWWSHSGRGGQPPVEFQSEVS